MFVRLLSRCRCSSLNCSLNSSNDLCATLFKRVSHERLRCEPGVHHALHNNSTETGERCECFRIALQLRSRAVSGIKRAHSLHCWTAARDCSTASRSSRKEREREL